MKTTQIKIGRMLTLLVAGLLATAGAMAEKPDWAGSGGKHSKEGKEYKQDKQAKQGKSKQKELKEHRGDSAPGQHDRMEHRFGDDQRTVVRNYYSEQYRVGRCPPGLAKKNNGCLPPGQARKWAVGHPLPSNVVYYSMPPSVVVQLGVAPVGHRYVRVASDILLIAIGTGMVVDAIQDLGRQ